MKNYSRVFKIIILRIKYELRESGKAAGYALKR